jgi:CheY-like chemotaxis protein
MAAPPPHHGKFILLIDDDIVTQETVSLILAGDGCRVAAARNGAEALARLRQAACTPDLIVLDLKMPVMDGHTFCRNCQQEPSLAGIPLVILSAAPDVAEQAAALGATAHLQKPFDAIDLLTTLRNCCSRPAAATADT